MFKGLNIYHLLKSRMYSHGLNVSCNNQAKKKISSYSSIFFVAKVCQIPFYAGRLGISVGHLHSVVKRVSGKSPGEWIEQYVTKEACAMLKCTDKTIQQISIELGFPSQSFFGKYFKRAIGLSPKEYRER
ncbi:MAG: helix-turn-helix domain-containing protein [Prevotella sp.]